MSHPEPLIDIIAGARPNFMKIAPILHALKARQAAGSRLRVRLVHTGQHYDERMSGDFFRQLGIPDPDVNLEVGSGTQVEQTAAIMVRYEQLLLQQRSALCLVVGDVTSTMACSIAARKCGVPVAHVEGGIRSGDWTMPEEINRLVTDAITHWFFTTSEVANANLKRAGVGDERIFFVGNTMIDTLLANLPHLRAPAFWAEAGLQPRGYFVMTLHRPANVDDAPGFARLLHAVGEATAAMPVVFPVHPRTAKTLREMDARDHRFRRHHRGDHGDGCAVRDAARHHRAPGDRDHRHQRADRHRPGGAEAGAGPLAGGPVEEGGDSRQVGRQGG